MIINGKDRQFELTVQAHSEISKLCQDEDFAKIDKLFSTSSASGNENLMRIAIIMGITMMENVAMTTAKIITAMEIKI